jgi:hypothetical protein
MLVKTSELIESALDWAVATYLNKPIVLAIPIGATKHEPYHPEASLPYCFSRDWSQAGPIIEREKIFTTGFHHDLWWATKGRDTDFSYSGSTPLIAAMRCYVASKLGNEVDIPKELL